ncbi:uncharacterized protein [Coffea arabica]|uniref:Integrase catalytic domain-containing protein n=1 Tax=Coffea arabica TaxID=13443 RepID=A0ABM4UYI8_COFAR
MENENGHANGNGVANGHVEPLRSISYRPRDGGPRIRYTPADRFPRCQCRVTYAYPNELVQSLDDDRRQLRDANHILTQDVEELSIMVDTQMDRIAELEQRLAAERARSEAAREELGRQRSRLTRVAEEVRDRSAGIRADATMMIDEVMGIIQGITRLWIDKLEVESVGDQLGNTPRLVVIGNHIPRTWANFTREFNAKFLPPLIQEKREDDFIKCRQGAVSVAEYEIQFTKLSRFAPELIATEQRRVRRFVQGLNVEMQEGLAAVRIDTFADVVERGQRVEVARAQENPSRPRKDLAQAAVGSRLMQVLHRPKRAGHTEDGCWRKEGKCLRCGSSEHQIAGCPKIQEGGTPSARQATAGGNRPKVPARVYAMDDQPVPDSSEDVEGTLPIFHRLARVLIDPGATHSFVNPIFMSGIDVQPVKLPFDLEVRLPMGNRSIITSLAYKNCEFWVGEGKMLVDLVSLDIKGYDAIIGMDFLAHYHAKLDCRAKVVEFWIPGEATLKLDVKGQEVSKDRIAVDPAKVETVTMWKQLETPTEVRSFLGLAGYYRRFIKDFSKIAGPMTELTKKNSKFIWTPKCESSFQELKKRLTSAPILALPDGVEGYVVYYDASKEGKANVVADALSRKAQVAGLMVKEWDMLEEDVAKFVQNCLICQQVKAEHQKPSGLLQPLEIPEWKWEHIAMDFVTGLPRSQQGFDAIWVIVDRLTKSAHFLPVSMSFSLEKLAKLYTEEIMRLHGIPISIVSDRDPRFVSRFWQKFQETLGTKLKFSTAYHPQTDGQSERTIQTLENMLRSCILDFGGKWSQYMALVEFAYNNSYHASIQMAPYEALYGRRCRSPIHWDEVGEKKILDSTVIPWMEEAREKVKVIRERLQTAQSRQKSYADTRRKDLEFEVGDRVFLRVKPAKGGVVSKKGKKLKPRYIGPFEILKRIGKVAYQLQLPSSMAKIHNVFHVSMLKKYHPDPSHVLQLEGIEVDESLTYEEGPVRILEREVKELRDKKIPLVKILWKNHGMEEATWELEADMQRKYPELFL